MRIEVIGGKRSSFCPHLLLANDSIAATGNGSNLAILPAKEEAAVAVDAEHAAASLLPRHSNVIPLKQDGAKG